MGGFQQPTVFISYAREDIETARRLYEDLKRAGAEPWFDKESLLPGQKWKVAIRQAITDSRYFLAVLSSKSVTKRGFVHRELTEALELLDEFPESEIFIIPVRLDDSRPSHEKLLELHWVDMFPSWEDGLKKILRAIRVTPKARKEEPEVVERVLVLEIPGLEEIDAEIYLASDNTNWEADPGWKYHEGEKPGTYTLRMSMERGLSFKHFAVSEIEDR